MKDSLAVILGDAVVGSLARLPNARLRFEQVEYVTAEPRRVRGH